IRTSPDQSLLGSSPTLFAARYVLLRHLLPRHPPCALHVSGEPHKIALATVLPKYPQLIAQYCMFGLPNWKRSGFSALGLTLVSRVQPLKIKISADPAEQSRANSRVCLRRIPASVCGRNSHYQSGVYERRGSVSSPYCPYGVSSKQRGGGWYA